MAGAESFVFYSRLFKDAIALRLVHQCRGPVSPQDRQRFKRNVVVKE